jgi:hypothetical protein
LCGAGEKLVVGSVAPRPTPRLPSTWSAPHPGVLLFDCGCRGMILKNGFDKEIEAVRSVFGNVPIAGFLTYGEIARYPGKLNGWHNATAVVVAIPE